MVQKTDFIGWIVFKWNFYTLKYIYNILALFKKSNSSNIVIVSWQGMTLPFKNPHTGLLLSTREASKNVQRVSKHVADFIIYLKNETKVHNASEIHLIGHGLGAQVSEVTLLTLTFSFNLMGNSFTKIRGIFLVRLLALLALELSTSRGGQFDA